MLAKDIKPGTIIVQNSAPCLIESVQVQSPSARGGATLYKFRARNLVSKSKVDITLKGTEGLDDADFKKREASVMYSDTEAMHLMDSENYEQYALPLTDAENELKYMKEGQEGVLALIYNDQCVGINIPATVELTIAQCDPGVKGNSATGRTKSLTLETGLQIQGPEYLKEGEVVKVDTRTGEFLGRA